MKKISFLGLFMGLAVLVAAQTPASAGDSLYGTVKFVQSGEFFVFDYGEGEYTLHLIGIEVPPNGPIADQAKAFVADMVLGKKARIRFEGRTEEGDMMVRLFTDDPEFGIKEVGVELVRAGLAQRERGFDFKYGELAAAQEEARAKNLGIWAETEPQ